MASLEPEAGPTWAQRAELGALEAVLDPDDRIGTKNVLIDRAHRAALSSALEAVPSGVRVDLGCGSGRLTAWLGEGGNPVVGVDSSMAMLAGARQAWPAVPFVVCDARHLPFRSGAVAAVVTVLVLQYAAVDPTVLGPIVADVAQALRPGGVLLALEQVHQGDLGRGAPAATYEAAFVAAGLEVLPLRHVRRSDSVLVRLLRRWRWPQRVRGIGTLVTLEARLRRRRPEGDAYAEVVLVGKRPDVIGAGSS